MKNRQSKMLALRLARSTVFAIFAMAGMLNAAQSSSPREEKVATSQPAAPIWDEARMIAFAAYLEQKVAKAQAAMIVEKEVTPDPFEQLEKIGLDGVELREFAEEAQIDIEPVESINLAAVDIAELDADERRCLSQAIYYEARNQSAAGQMAVADVVLNRVESRHYPNSICDVVYQGSHRVTGCQFSFTCDGSMDKGVDQRAMREARSLATAIMAGFRLPLSNEALNYHATYVSPYWAPTLQQTAVVGDHVFYTPVRRRTRLAMAQ